MKTRLLIFFCLLFSPVLFASSSEEPTIKVLLIRDVDETTVEVKGAYKVTNLQTGGLLSLGAIGKRFPVKAFFSGIRWGELYPDAFQIAIHPQGESSALFVEGVQYRGNVNVFRSPDNHITLVNAVPIEDFLLSSLTTRFENALSKEAMAAVVILARTEAYQRAQGDASRAWDVTADETTYFGSGILSSNEAVESAVIDTRFMVMEGIDHEVKLSLKGVEELAGQGYDARQILAKFYPQMSLSLIAKR